MIEHAAEGPDREMPRYLRIGEQVADRVRNLILRDGELHRVEPKVMDVLVYLAQAEGRIVSRRELMEQVWGVHVVDEAVQRAVSLLRVALGCDGRTSPILETIRGQGYRLTLASAEVECPRRRSAFLAAPPLAALALAFTAGVAGTLLVIPWAPDGGAFAPPAPPASAERPPAEAPRAPQ